MPLKQFAGALAGNVARMRSSSSATEAPSGNSTVVAEEPIQSLKIPNGNTFTRIIR
jgi:hypothetical protein